VNHFPQSNFPLQFPLIKLLLTLTSFVLGFGSYIASALPVYHTLVAPDLQQIGASGLFSLIS
jgi:hypothetical protein